MSLDAMLRILQFINNSEHVAFYSDIYRFVKKELRMGSKATLSSYLKKLCEKGFIEKLKQGTYKITEAGILNLASFEKGKEYIEEKMKGDKPCIVRAYSLDIALRPGDLDKKMNLFTEKLKELGFDDYTKPRREKFGWNRWNKMICLTGPGPFKVHRGEIIDMGKGKLKTRKAADFLVPTLPPVVAVHISKVMLLIQVYPPDVEEGIPSLKDFFGGGEVKDILRSWLDATWWYIRIMLRGVFGRKIKSIKPIDIKDWVKPVNVIYKIGPTAPKSRL